MMLAAAALLAGVGLAWVAGGVMMRGQTARVPQATGMARDFKLAASDGVVLAATYRRGARPDAPAVLLLHGVNASRGAVAGNAAWLSAQGYATLAIDFRGHGESTPRPRSFGWHESRDAHAAFAWLKRRQRGAPVAVIGISMGGAASLVGPAGPLPADALILQAVYPDIRHAIRNRIADRLGSVAARLLEPLLSYQSRPRIGVWPDVMSPMSAMARFAGPVMVIGGVEDHYSPPIETRALYAAAPGARALLLVPHGDHAAICDLTDDRYRGTVAAFLRRQIGDPNRRPALANRARHPVAVSYTAVTA
jgi:pimeloyl-ACP methyl ester carboxylesterase